MSDTPELVIANGTVVNSFGRRHAHVVVREGRIDQLVDAAEPVPAAHRVIDAAGRLVIPGGVDGHCHVAQITGRFRTLDDYRTTSTAALWGGTTTIIDFGIPRDARETPLAAVLHKKELARESRCDVALHGSVVSWDETVPWQLEQLAAEGVRSVKMYTTNRGTTMADGDTILKVMREMVRLDGLTYIHAEHDPIIADCTEQHADDGRIGIEHLHRTRPELAEEVSVKETLAMAEYTGAPVYFVHQSTPGAVDLVSEARARGQEAYSETCPHYLTLDNSVYGSVMPEWYACCPPMRSPQTVAALRERLADGAIHTVASDHSCYDLTQKRERTDDIREMPHGLPGVETRMPVTFTALMEAAGDGEARVEDFVEVFAAGPARINALPRKGTIAPGFDADLVIFDPAEERVVDGGALHMGTDFSPFDGRTLTGWPAVVVSAGRVVLDSDGFHDPGAVGRFVPRAGFREHQSAAPSAAASRRPGHPLGAPMPSATRPTRIGMIVPSSNTCLEPQSYRILGDRDDVTIHFARIPVTRIALDKSSDKQFDAAVMRSAAELLATADVDVIAWNGTSGSWLGADHDRRLVEDITDATGIPATTSTLAYMEAFRTFGTERIGLFTPYTGDVNEQIMASYQRDGIKTLDHRFLGLSDNESFARVADEEMRPGSLELAAARPDAIIYLCTNLYGANITAEIEAATGVPVLDSVAVTLWHCLKMAGAPLLDPRWGRLLGN